MVFRIAESCLFAFSIILFTDTFAILSEYVLYSVMWVSFTAFPLLVPVLKRISVLAKVVPRVVRGVDCERTSKRHHEADEFVRKESVEISILETISFLVCGECMWTYKV